MPINLCSNCGRITGYRTCPWCGGANNTIRQAPPFVNPVQAGKVTPPIRVRISWDSLVPFRAWRKAHRQKVALREALRAIDAYRKGKHV